MAWKEGKSLACWSALLKVLAVQFYADQCRVIEPAPDATRGDAYLADRGGSETEQNGNECKGVVLFKVVPHKILWTHSFPYF
jgi:hypothetical protein